MPQTYIFETLSYPGDRLVEGHTIDDAFRFLALVEDNPHPTKGINQGRVRGLEVTVPNDGDTLHVCLYADRWILTPSNGWDDLISSLIAFLALTPKTVDK